MKTVSVVPAPFFPRPPDRPRFPALATAGWRLLFLCCCGLPLLTGLIQLGQLMRWPGLSV